MFASIATALILAAAPVETPTYKDRVFDPSGLDLASLKTLADRGTLVMVDDDDHGKPELVTALTVVETPPEAVYDVITNYKKFTKFMPQLQRIEVLEERDDGTRDVQFELKFKFSIVSQKVKYTARFHTYEPNRKVGFEFIEGDLKDGGGSYLLLPWNEGKETLMFYSTVSKVDDMGYVMRTLLKEQPHMEAAIHASTAEVVSSAVKKRAEAEWAKKSQVSGVRP